jgi:hypothetical protein
MHLCDFLLAAMRYAALALGRGSWHGECLPGTWRLCSGSAQQLVLMHWQLNCHPVLPGCVGWL